MNTIPLSQALLTVSKALTDEIITDSGLKLYLDPTYSKEWHSSVTATIAALPVKPSPKHQKILEQLSVGDEVCMSYRVVADFEFASDSDRFMPVTEGNDYVRRFVNGKGEWIHVVALPGKISKIWVGYYMNKRKELISGTQGTQHQVERWMAQFPYDKTDNYKFNNFFSHAGQDYWKCELDDIFAKRTKDGHLVAVGNRIICKPIEEDVPAEVLQNVQHHGEVKIRYQDRARVISGGKEKGLKKDDVVSFMPNHLEKYEFFGKQYYLINQNLVLGTWQS